ncbi:MAG: sigma factor, partial [Coprobacillus sp.]
MILQWIKGLFFRRKTLFYIGRHDVLKAPLKGQEEENALIKLANGDQEARDLLIEHNLRLVVYVAKKYDSVQNGSIEDLISIGTIGLVKAVNTFKMDKNIKLATYASR